MYVGNGAVISNSFFPWSENTGLTDRSGNTLYTRDIVRIYGCTAKYGVIGRSYSNSKYPYAVYFGGRNGSVEWYLDPDTLRKLTKMKTMPEDWE